VVLGEYMSFKFNLGMSLMVEGGAGATGRTPNQSHDKGTHTRVEHTMIARICVYILKSTNSTRLV